MAEKIADAPILILPGINNSGPAHWQTLWEHALPGARRVQARDWDNPDRTSWVLNLDVAVAACSEPPVLVAHSLGCLQVAHWSATSDRTVRGALLVAPPDPNGPVFPAPDGWGFRPLPTRRLPFRSVLIASTNDPFGSAEFTRRCADTWGSQFADAGPLGHINADSHLGTWEEGRAWLDRLRFE